MPLKKIVRNLILSAAVIFVAIIAAQMTLNYYINHKIKADLENEVAYQSEGLYSLTINNMKANLLSRSIEITNIGLVPNISKRDKSKPVYQLASSQIILTGINLLVLLKNHELIIQQLKLVSPTVRIYRAENYSKEADNKKDKRCSPYSLIQKRFQLLLIKAIEVSDVNVKVFDHMADSNPSLSSTNTIMSVTDFKIDKKVDDLNKFFTASKFEIATNDFSYITDDSLYEIKVKRAKFSHTNSVLSLEQIKLIPNYSKAQFGNAAGKQVDRLKISALRTNFDQVDIKLFFERGWMIAKTLTVDSLAVNAYRDKNDLFDNKRKKNVQQLIRAIPFIVKIDSLIFKDAHIVYEEVKKGAAKTGKIFFSKLNATVTGLNNDTLITYQHKKLELNATTLFMGKGKVEVHYSFPLNTEKTIFDCSGKLSNFDLHEINPFTERIADISVKNGKVESLTFAFHANDEVAIGKMKLIYHDLKIEFLNNNPQKKGLIEKIKTAIVQKIIIKENNPSPNEAIREVGIYYIRDPNRFIFGYSVKSLMSGIKSTMTSIKSR